LDGNKVEKDEEDTTCTNTVIISLRKRRTEVVARKLDLDTLNWIGLCKLAGRGQFHREKFDGYMI
jgi:hypothetical protein